MNLLYVDVESCGLNGPTMRIQYAHNDGPIHFIDRQPDGKWFEDQFLDLCFLIDEATTTLVAYNAAFDLYHLYRTFEEVLGKKQRAFACKVLDLQVPAMLSGPFKNFAFSKSKARAVARVRRIPVAAVAAVRTEVLKRLRPLVPDVFDILTGEHECKGQPHLRTMSFSVDGRMTLKAHAKHYGADTLSLADNWPLPERVDGKSPEKPWLLDWGKQDALYKPLMAKAFTILSTPGHPFHQYCALDIWFLRLLYEKFGKPEPDHHSQCVAAVAYTRYHGFPVDLDCMERTRKFYKEKVDASEKALEGTNLKSSKQRLALIRSVDPLIASSARKVLETLATSERPSAGIAGSMLDAGRYRQRLLQVEKVMESRRAYPSLRVMGTPTGRMAGTDGLNWQGIAQAETDSEGKPAGIRAAMQVGCGGDFDALEVGIAAAVYDDEVLQADLDAGIDPHSMIASMLPAAIKQNMTWQQIWEGHKAKKPLESKLRKQGKGVLFATIFGAQEQKIAEVIGGTEGEAKKFLEKMFKRYVGIGGFRAQAERDFCTADTERWEKGSVRKMHKRIVDLLGNARQFDFECAVAGVLWELGSSELSSVPNGLVLRTKEKGQQTVKNAVKSAFLGGALAIQAAVMRQACNSPVQSTGANLTKILLGRLWERFHTPLLCIHDEILAGCELTPEITKMVEDFLKEFRVKVPSLSLKMVKLKTWSEK